MIISGTTKAGLEGLARGIHAETDDYYMALYAKGAELNRNTAAYTSTHEVKGAKYTPGGMRLSTPKYKWDGEFLIMYFDDPVWPNSSIVAAGAMIYNRSKGSRSLYVGAFPKEITSINGNFRAVLPAATAKTGLIRLALG